MSDDNAATGCAVTIWTIFVALAVGWLVHDNAVTSWRDEAVKHGAAEYYLDANHERQWRWKQPEQKVEEKP